MHSTADARNHAARLSGVADRMPATMTIIPPTTASNTARGKPTGVVMRPVIRGRVCNDSNSANGLFGNLMLWHAVRGAIRRPLIGAPALRYPSQRGHSSVPLPKLAIPCGRLRTSFGSDKDTSKPMFLVWFWI